MQAPSQLVVTTSGLSNPYPLDRYVNGYAVAVTFPKTGVGFFTLQQCFDNPFQDDLTGTKYSNSYNTSGTWVNFSDPVMVNASTNAVSNLAFIPRAIRVNASAKVSAGNPLVLNIVPLGMDGN